MKKETRKKRLTVMLVPHSGSRIRSIELTHIFFLSVIVGIAGIIFLSVFFTFRYVEGQNILRRNIEYVADRNATIDKISSEIEKAVEVSKNFSNELEKTETLFDNASLSSQDLDVNQIREGDFAQAFDVVSQNFSEQQEVNALMNLSQQIEENIPILENINNLVSSQKNLFAELPVYWPVRGARVSMEWGPNIHPVFGRWYIHKGIDLAALTGTPVQTAANGEVSFIGYDSGYGLHIYITHRYGFKTHYSHLSAINVKKGQRVKQGQVIGKVGATGLVTGAHLDFQLYLGNELVDPGVYLRVLNSYDRPKGNR